MTRGAASGGKRSMNNTLTQAYSGASASQQIRAAEWAGQLAWNDSHHPPSAGAASSSMVVYQEPDVDYDMPWFEQRNGEWYCTLCSKFASESHVTSSTHVQRAENPHWYGFTGLVGGGDASCPPCASDFSQPWFELRQGEQFCLLCSAYATEGHVTSERHKKREMWPSSYGFPSSGPAMLPTHLSGQQPLPLPAASSVGAAIAAPPQYQAYYFQFKEGDWYCLLCGAWATDTHLTGGRHVKRAACPQYYLPNGEAAVVVASRAAALPALANAPYAGEEPLPPPWESHYSHDHHRYYYYDVATGVSTWERPPAPAPAPFAPAENWAAPARQAQQQTSSSAAASAAAASAAAASAASVASAAAQHFSRTLYLPEHIQGKRIVFDTEDPASFLVDKSELQGVSTHVAYRKSRRIDDHAEDGMSQEYGTSVQGMLQDGWLEVQFQVEELWVDTAEWTRHYDTTFALHYYHNKMTGDTQWELPVVVAAVQPPPPAASAPAAAVPGPPVAAGDAEAELIDV